MSYIPKWQYIDEAEKLPIGGSSYIPHQGCTPNNKMWVYHSRDGWGCFCNKCSLRGFTKKGIQRVDKLQWQQCDGIDVNSSSVDLPDDISYTVGEWPSDAKLWLYKADIRNFQIKKYGIGYSKRLHRVIIPVYNESEEGLNLITWQGRGLTSEQTKYLNLSGNKKNESFFKSWVSKEKVHKYSKDRVILVEDALSVIKVGRIVPTVAALGTSLSTTQLNFLTGFKKVSLWLDDDRGGLMGSKKSMSRIGLFTDVERIRTSKDPKEYSYDEIQEILNEN